MVKAPGSQAPSSDVKVSGIEESRQSKVSLTPNRLSRIIIGESNFVSWQAGLGLSVEGGAVGFGVAGFAGGLLAGVLFPGSVTCPICSSLATQISMRPTAMSNAARDSLMDCSVMGMTRMARLRRKGSERSGGGSSLALGFQVRSVCSSALPGSGMVVSTSFKLSGDVPSLKASESQRMALRKKLVSPYYIHMPQYTSSSVISTRTGIAPPRRRRIPIGARFVPVSAQRREAPTS